MVERTTLIKKIGFAILIVSIILFVTFPFLQMLSTSLKYSWDWGNPSFIPKKINIERYLEILNIKKEPVDLSEVPKNIQLLLENPNLNKAQRDVIIAKYIDTSAIFPFLKYFKNSLLVAGLASLFSIVIAVFGAYAISRLRFPGKKILNRGVLFVYMFGGILLLIPLYRMASLLHLLDTAIGSIIALFIVYMIQTLPVSLYMLGNYFRSIPYSIEESALIEGCSRIGIIFRIIIPLSLSAILSVYIYAFMIAWNEYLFASVFLKSFPQFHTLSLGLKTVFTSKNAVWDLVMAASVLTSVPVIIAFSFVQKKLVQGLTSGGVKE